MKYIHKIKIAHTVGPKPIHPPPTPPPPSTHTETFINTTSIYFHTPYLVYVNKQLPTNRIKVFLQHRKIHDLLITRFCLFRFHHLLKPSGI